MSLLIVTVPILEVRLVAHRETHLKGTTLPFLKEPPISIDEGRARQGEIAIPHDTEFIRVVLAP